MKAKKCGFAKSLEKLTKIFTDFSYFVVQNREISKMSLQKCKCDPYVTLMLYYISKSRSLRQDFCALGVMKSKTYERKNKLFGEGKVL